MTDAHRPAQKRLDRWIEIEDTFLTDTPRGTEQPPTKAYLFAYECKRSRRGVQRKRSLVTIDCKGHRDLDRKIAAFCQRRDVVLIEDVRP